MNHNGGNRIEAVYARYLESLLQGNKGECIRIVSELLDADISVRALYVDLLQRSMYDVGERWEQNKISVAKEHLATSITEFLLTLAYPKIFAVPRMGRKAVIACVASEYHQLGARMVADIFELNGWDSCFLGANTPISGLLAMLQDHRPDLLCLSLGIYTNFPKMVDTVTEVRSANPDLPILVGGQAFRWGSAETLTRLPNVTYLDSVESLETRLGSNST